MIGRTDKSRGADKIQEICRNIKKEKWRAWLNKTELENEVRIWSKLEIILGLEISKNNNSKQDSIVL